MTAPVNMYVFYNKTNEIKAITPSLNDFLDDSCSVAALPIADVEGFLTGKKSTLDYRIQKTKLQSGEKISLIKKVVNVDYQRRLDNYLTEIGTCIDNETIISIINCKSKKVITVEIAPEFRKLQSDNNTSLQDNIDNFLNSGKISIYITKKHNPYHLLFGFNFTAEDLISRGTLHFNYDTNLIDASAYTKKIFNGYGYKEKV